MAGMKIRNTLLTFSTGLNAIFMALMIFGQIRLLKSMPQPQVDPTQVEQVKSLDAVIASKEAPLKSLDDQLTAIESHTPLASTDTACFYDLDSNIFLVKFRPEQREIWIERNSQTANFSDELIAWLRSNATFYVSQAYSKDKNLSEYLNDSYIFLPPCMKTDTPGHDLPVCMKARFIILKQVSKEEYLASR